MHVQPLMSDFAQLTDPDEVMIIYLEALTNWARVSNDMQLKCPMMYGVIWSYLSAESIDEVKNYDMWNIYGASKDPEGLWQAIVVTHGVSSVSKVPEVKNRLLERHITGVIKEGLKL